MQEISLDKPMARGRTADVYAWDAGYVLKLFHPWFRLEDIHYELKIAKAVHASGVSAPAVIDKIIQFESRNGLIYERIAGQSMLEVAQRQPWKVFTLAKRFATLHTRMHEHVLTADIPTQRSKFDYRIRHNDTIPESLRAALLERLASLPDGEKVCHGDFHPGNVLLTQHGDTVIDWIDASRGNPLADVARASIILRGAMEAGQTPSLFTKLFVGVFHTAYLRHYFKLRPAGKQEYQRWLPIVAAARLSEGIQELETWLLEQAKRI